MKLYQLGWEKLSVVHLTGVCIIIVTRVNLRENVQSYCWK